MFVTAPSHRTETTTITATSRRRPTRHVATPAPGPVEFTWANRRPGTAGFARWMADLGRRIDEHGLTGCAHDVDNLVTVAVRLGVAPIAVAVLQRPHPERSGPLPSLRQGRVNSRHPGRRRHHGSRRIRAHLRRHRATRRPSAGEPTLTHAGSIRSAVDRPNNLRPLESHHEVDPSRALAVERVCQEFGVTGLTG